MRIHASPRHLKRHHPARRNRDCSILGKVGVVIAIRLCGGSDNFPCLQLLGDCFKIRTCRRRCRLVSYIIHARCGSANEERRHSGQTCRKRQCRYASMYRHGRFLPVYLPTRLDRSFLSPSPISVGLGGTDRSPASVEGVANSMLSVEPSVMAMRPKLFFQ